MSGIDVRGEIQAAVEDIDSGRSDTARQTLVTLLANLNAELREEMVRTLNQRRPMTLPGKPGEANDG